MLRCLPRFSAVRSAIDPSRDARCTACARSYPDGDYTPVPPPDRDVQSKWGLWEQLQANGAEVYDGDPVGNLSVGDRQDARAFASSRS